MISGTKVAEVPLVRTLAYPGALSTAAVADTNPGRGRRDRPACHAQAGGRVSRRRAEEAGGGTDPRPGRGRLRPPPCS
ncbi:unnamed protein product [Ixodes pacificus]